MLEQDILDTLFLNRKALADVRAPNTTTTHTPETTTTTMAKSAPTDDKAAADQCPVDHKSREAWLAHAKAAQQPTQPPPPPEPPSSSATSSWRSWRIPFLTSPPPPPPTTPLGNDRQVSSIPRSATATATTTGTSTRTRSCPANHETETGADAATGNWVYPSEKMFFDAMRRKGHATRAADMAAVVPIHNAVNERAWREICAWERPWQASSCPDGPRLHSFTGLSNQMSPRARLNTLLGYTAPFDRHDWVVDRCGTRVEYVIDFYTGKTAADGGAKPSFYLDVRPKLNSWEGVKMRASRACGLV